MKTLRLLFSTFLVVGLFAINTYAQGQLSVVYQKQIAPNKVTVSIWLKNTTASEWGYATGNYTITCVNTVATTSTLTATLDSTSLGSYAPNAPTINTTVSPIRILFSAKTPADGGPMIPAGDSIKAVVFTLTTSAAAFNQVQANFLVKVANPNRTSISKYNAGNSGTQTVFIPTVVYYHVDAALPVELTSFTNLVRGRDVRLDWKTATEVNSSKFEIERASINESGAISEYAKIATVAAHGISNVPVDYSYSDRKLNAGKYSYRLKMIDADGTVNYSKIQNEATVALPDNYAMSQNYPNPFNPSTKIDYQLPQDASVTLELYTVSGEKIATLINGQEQPAGFHTYNFSSNQANHTLASGMYLYRLIASGKDAEKFVSVKKMILMK